ncbi:UDP-N-acetylmuramoyl-tripeptide--D-alanyl-D-alanine ligase [Dokdonia sinensis]|uniref:UDP-N-acetylmuramoyl-tripeptide--D-alanyl-D-alanine ligase n=1 Tax=Dokdonia sinensis TaxID=2479847 RepID=A0A3M0FWF9_9FLAO|nr:UDP-N-acetylmuramoyl-tripeptide--D-alanyl-D-alanine ligase [Dokdonia sinensis]RMB57100.1 UDP-N-acetylmuramoyl-tripeptide--D-alanyl-D-alanine ligase [Dokdonia sinensis]
MEIAQLHKIFLESTGVCTDTRKLLEGNLYVALKGENFNGNVFAKAALAQGASYAVIDEPGFEEEKTILVHDALETLQKLASFHRAYLGLPIIALTGSNGKTTTKELINVVLSQRFKTSATRGNLNNHIGVPLTLLGMDKTTEIGIVEMGANHQGEIAQLCAIAKPNYGYITNFGKAHLEGFGGVEGVIKGKSELYDFLRSNGGLVFLNNDDTKQIEKSEGCKNYTFGVTHSDIVIDDQNANPYVSLSLQGIKIKSQLIGAYNGTNIAAAIAIGNYFEVKIEEIRKGVENYLPSNNRSQIIQKGGASIILDAYNANPTSMEAALRSLSAQPADYRVAFLGDMFEVGATTQAEHKNIARIAISLGIDEIYLVGKHFAAIADLGPSVFSYESFKEFQESFKGLRTRSENKVILVKGSRGMAMERVLDMI